MMILLRLTGFEEKPLPEAGSISIVPTTKKKPPK
jgi:hypothetical protein